MATNDMESPMASATGPHFRSDAAAPRTIGRMGSTQGDNTDSMPAASARARLASVIGPRSSQDLVEQSGDRLTVGVSGRSTSLGRAFEGDQRGLRPGAETPDQPLLPIETTLQITTTLYPRS